jgi:hypothetical protein
MDLILAEKRKLALGLVAVKPEPLTPPEPAKQIVDNKKAVLLAAAAGVLPSVIAEVFCVSLKAVKNTIEENKPTIAEICRSLTVDYQAIRVNMLFDAAISRLQEIVEGDTASKASELISAVKEISRMIKDGDVGRVFNREIMDDTFESAPDNVDVMLKKIREIEQKEKELLG